jgi:hypothetical protein
LGGEDEENFMEHLFLAACGIGTVVFLVLPAGYLSSADGEQLWWGRRTPPFFFLSIGWYLLSLDSLLFFNQNLGVA